MKKKSLVASILLVLVFALPNPQAAQTTADPQLLAEIAKIKAIDNHAHPLRYVAQGEQADQEYDALPLEGLEPFALPPRVNPSNPEYIGAWRALFGYKHNDMNEAHLNCLVRTRLRSMPKLVGKR